MKKQFITEFKAFLMRGNVIDMAVGIILGSSFTAIVNSIVQEMLMPMLNLAVSGIDLSTFKFVLRPAAGDVPELAVLYGSVIQHIISFFIMSFIIFCLIKLLGTLKLKKEAAAPPPPVSKELEVLIEIRDLLKAQL
ncbi:MAG: large-conductance mechanosensitive channel protein MscL [Clostridiales bacterium]|jgi:large conductance mechanosensitive channel|nr:large-conductance mechanosensitive channel protein MscL [Clostridiales bacterium]